MSPGSPEVTRYRVRPVSPGHMCTTVVTSRIVLRPPKRMTGRVFVRGKWNELGASVEVVVGRRITAKEVDVTRRQCRTVKLGFRTGLATRRSHVLDTILVCLLRSRCRDGSSRISDRIED